MIQRKISLMFATILLTGCASSVPKPEIIQRSGVDILAITDDYEVTYIKKPGDLQRICAARPADAVATDEAGISLGLSGLEKSQNIGEMSGRGELGLGGRDPAVLIAREFLFRACELSNNINANGQTTIDIYKLFLKSLEKITAHHLNDGTKSVSSEVSPYTIPKNSTIQNNKPDDSDEIENQDEEDSDEEDSDEE